MTENADYRAMHVRCHFKQGSDGVDVLLAPDERIVAVDHEGGNWYVYTAAPLVTSPNERVSGR